MTCKCTTAHLLRGGGGGGVLPGGDMAAELLLYQGPQSGGDRNGYVTRSWVDSHLDGAVRGRTKSLPSMCPAVP